jgi:site-specific DNA recombinase
MSIPSVPNGSTPRQAHEKYAAIYARVSTEDQGKGYSIPTQIEACQRLAQHEGYLVPQDYLIKDEDTGKELERLGLCKLRELVRTNSIAAIIIYDPDRLSRILGHQLLLAEEADKAGIKLLIVSYPMGQGPEGWLFFQMRGALAEYERAKILERTKRGAIGRIQAGHPWGGSVPLGYRYIAAPHAGQWTIDEEEAALVRRIFAMCLSGMTTRAIARALTAERIPTPSDRDPKRHGMKKRLPVGVWAHATIRGILRNETYIGKAYWGKREQLTKTTRRSRPVSEWLSFSIPALIDPKTFAAAQQALSYHKAIATRNRKHEYLFTNGRLRCGRCGRPMRGFWRRGGIRYYICSSHQDVHDPALRCPRSLRADIVETYVWEKLIEFLENPARLREKVAKEQVSAEKQRAVVRHELVNIEAALMKCDATQKRWNDAYEAEIIALEELKAYRADIATSRQSLLVQQRACQERLDAIGQAADRVESLIDYCARVHQNLKTVSMAEKRRALEALDVKVRWIAGEPEPLEVKGIIPFDSLVDIQPGSNSREFPAHCDFRHGGAGYPHFA